MAKKDPKNPADPQSQLSPEPPPVPDPKPEPSDPPSLPEGSAKVEDAPKVSMTLDDLAGHAEERAPEPNQEAIDRRLSKEKEKGQDEPTGTGRGANQTGKKRGSYNKGDKKEKNTPPDELKKAGELYKRRYRSGVEAIEIMVGTAEKTMGSEWGWRPPEDVILPSGEKFKISERERGHDAFGRGFAEMGWDGPSPGWAMVFFAVNFSLSRLNQPQTKEKVKGIASKIKEWYVKRKVKQETGLSVKVE